MPDLVALIQTGAHNPWLYLPVAIVLGALHALEPGHAKSVMAAFIVAVRGTARQAVLLGTAAAIGHSLVIWGLAIIGLMFGDALILGKAEPWLITISGILICILALRILRGMPGHHGDHTHDDHHHDQHDHAGHGHSGHEHTDHTHPHNHDAHAASAPTAAPLDAHAAQHEREIARYTGRTLSNGEIFWFGLTGGLLPCPSALAVLLVCMQLKAFTLGFAMVIGFSLGLAITLIAVGLIAAWSVQKAQQSSNGRFMALAAKLPYASAGLVMVIGIVMIGHGVMLLRG